MNIAVSCTVMFGFKPIHSNDVHI